MNVPAPGVQLLPELLAMWKSRREAMQKFRPHSGPVTAPGCVKGQTRLTTSHCSTALLSQEGTDGARSQVAPRPCSCRHLALSALQEQPHGPKGQPCFLKDNLGTKPGKLPLLTVLEVAELAVPLLCRAS